MQDGSSALDVTVCKCDQSDHSAIVIQVGHIGPDEKQTVKDWKNMDWGPIIGLIMR